MDADTSRTVSWSWETRRRPEAQSTRASTRTARCCTRPPSP